MILAIIQARIGSRRLPGKVMMQIKNRPIIEHVYLRTLRAKLIDEVVVATSSNPENDALVNYLDWKSINFFRGSEEDVLGRFIQVINEYNLQEEDSIVRITADCPLIDAKIIDEVIKLHIENGNDYTSNTIIRSYPDGLDCEVVRVKLLQDLLLYPLEKAHKEHVTSFIVEKKDMFKTQNLLNKKDQSKLRWTLDTMEDFRYIEKIYNNVSAESEEFGHAEIMEIVDSFESF